MSKPIHCYKLPHKVKDSLIKHGFGMSGNLFNMTAEQLNKIIHLPMEECEQVINEVNSKEPDLICTNASILLKKELSSDSTIPTLCEQLNSMLGDGFPLGRLCEVAGGSGSGKTQLCFQLCVTVQLPKEIGGLAADAFYIDIENSFRLPRIEEITTFVKNKMRGLANFNANSVANHIFVERCKELSHLQVLILEKLEPFLQQNPQVRLIIVDSIAYLMRYDFEGSPNDRKALLWSISNKLKELASIYNLCVIVTNHVRYEPESGMEKPALGACWSHYCAVRLFLKKIEDSDRRVATLIKSIKNQESSIIFRIGPQGIYDADERE